MQEFINVPLSLNVSHSKVSKQLGEWSAILQHREGTPLQKATTHVVFPMLIVSVPVIAAVPAFGAAVGYEFLVKDKSPLFFIKKALINFEYLSELPLSNI